MGLMLDLVLMLDMVILALRRLRQEEHEFDAILGYILKPDQTRPNHMVLKKGKGIFLGYRSSDR